MTRRRYLNETQDFLQLYRYAAGQSEVPTEFHLWCGLALIAACVADRVWSVKFRGAKLAPNLYTILLGPSGLGKGEAVECAMKFVKDKPIVNLYAGETTTSYLMHALGTEERKKIKKNTKLFLVNEELGMCVGEGPEAANFIKHITGLYKGGSYPIRKGTVTRKEVVIRDCCLNWLAGSTQDWLIESVPRSAIMGGFLGRCIVTKGNYDLNVRYHEPIYPDDCDEVLEHLHARVESLTRTTGEFKMTPHAVELERQWYENRPVPSDPAVIPSWKRAHDLLRKLAMLLSLSRDGAGVIDGPEIINARKLTDMALRNVPELINLASSTTDTNGLQYVRQVVKESREIPHFVLLRRASNRGISGAQLRDIVTTLQGRREIHIEKSKHGDRGRPAQVYVWRTAGGPPVDEPELVTADVPAPDVDPDDEAESA